jgi:hypothetical protein
VRAKDFHWPDGILKVPRAMLRSPGYRSLSLAARCLLLELQDRWNPNISNAVSFSVRQAAEALGVSVATAGRAFQEAEDQGFIVKASESDFIGRRAREWRLTWLSVNGHEPRTSWPLAPEKKITVSPEIRKTAAASHQRYATQKPPKPPNEPSMT